MAIPKQVSEQKKVEELKTESPRKSDDEGKKPSNQILVGENGDILARYRIPIDNNQIDYQLQLPEDSDSSNFSDDDGIGNANAPAPEQ